MPESRLDYLVYIGRFQPFHLGHLAMLHTALQKAGKVVLILGSAFGPRTTKNPFSWEERRAMISAAVAEHAPERVADLIFVPVRDYNDTPRWVAAVQQAVAGALPQPGTVGLFGHFKDQTSSYLADFPAWPLVQQDNFGAVNASDLRRQWFESAGDLTTARDHLPAPVFATLAQFTPSSAFTDLVAEYRQLEYYRELWSVAPFPPIFVTVDAIVECRDQVLLIQRGGYPGRGTWALPGGFLDQNETVADAAIRELIEETCIALPREVVKAAQAGYQLFDYPQRSLRGRTLTHAFYYRLDLPALPAITAADDAANARWVAKADLAGMEGQIFEDHLLILDHFLNLID